MNTKSIVSSLLLIAALPFAGFGQQTTSGQIDYSITMQWPSRRQSDNDVSAPKEFTGKNTLLFNQQKGKWSSARQENRRGRNSGTTYLNFEKKEFLRTFKRRNNDTTFLIPSPFRTAEDFQLTGNKKKILGYECQEATATLRNQKVTLWFTKEIPLTFSPVNGLIPPSGGVVLAVQSKRMSASATSLKTNKIDETQLVVPQPSKQLSREDMQHMFQGRRGNRPPRPRSN